MLKFAKTLIFLLSGSLILFGCADSSSSGGGDDTPTVTLSATTTLKNGSFGVGCYIESNSSTQCICFENGTN